MDNLAVGLLSALPIPVDFFVSKKHPGHTNGELGFADSSGNIVFRATRVSSKLSPHKRLLLDASGNLLISMYRQDDGSWQGFKGGNTGDIIFRVQRTVNKFSSSELQVFLVGENDHDLTTVLKVKGSPFQRSCTIYRGNSIVAQTSLMYKLNQIWVRRNKFRVTIFPSSIDHMLVAALIVIFLD